MALTSPKMGLRIWDQLSDPYDHNQMANNWSKVDFHDHTPGRGVQIPTEGIADGAVTSAKLASAIFSQGSIFANSLDDAARLGLTDGATVRRGYKSIPGSESRTGTTYGTLTTPDSISSLVVPAGGLIFFLYTASWSETVSGAARAGVFLNSTQVVRQDITSQSVAEAALGGTANGSVRLFSTPYGLDSPQSTGSAALNDVTTGMVLGSVTTGSTRPGGICVLQGMAAGTYTLSIQFKATSGSVSASNRQLWAWTQAYA